MRTIECYLYVLASAALLALSLVAKTHNMWRNRTKFTCNGKKTKKDILGNFREAWNTISLKATERRD